MKFTNIFQLALLASLQVNAAPVSEPDALTSNPANELIRRASPAAVRCGSPPNSQNYPLNAVQNAYAALKKNEVLPTTQRPDAGGRYYPRPYGKNNGDPSDAVVVTALNMIPGCATRQTGFSYFEFPLTNPVFTGGVARSQGPDRVIAISPGPGVGANRTFTYCLAMTHRGAPTNLAFIPCT